MKIESKLKSIRGNWVGQSTKQSPDEVAELPISIKHLLYAVLTPLVVGCIPERCSQKIHDANATAGEQAVAGAIVTSALKCSEHSECSGKQICMNLPNQSPTCVNKPTTTHILFELPFEAGHDVICTQSWGNLKGTHGWSSAFFAIDLATPRTMSSGRIRAAAAGRAYVFANCPQPTGSPDKLSHDRCYQGWGNHIRIDHGDGVFSFYSHLESTLVQNEQIVEKGQIIGIEGGTGAAGHRHLHWDVQRALGDPEIQRRIISDPGLNGISIPFRFRVKIAGLETILSSDHVTCLWDDMTQPPWTAI